MLDTLNLLRELTGLYRDDEGLETGNLLTPDAWKFPLTICSREPRMEELQSFFFSGSDFLSAESKEDSSILIGGMDKGATFLPMHCWMCVVNNSSGILSSHRSQNSFPVSMMSL